MLKFKNRARTDYMFISYEELHGEGVDELRKKAKKAGDFDVGFHYLIKEDGWIEHGRDDKAWAGHTCPCDCTSTLWILVDGKEDEGLTDNQQSSLEYLHSLFPEATIVSENEED